MKFFHFSGVSSSAKIASTGHAGTQAPQSMRSSGWMNNWVAASNSASSFRGWMQSTGQASTHAVSFVPMQGSAMTYAMDSSSLTVDWFQQGIIAEANLYYTVFKNTTRSRRGPAARARAFGRRWEPPENIPGA